MAKLGNATAYNLNKTRLNVKLYEIITDANSKHIKHARAGFKTEATAYKVDTRFKNLEFYKDLATAHLLSFINNSINFLSTPFWQRLLKLIQACLLGTKARQNK